MLCYEMQYPLEQLGLKIVGVLQRIKINLEFSHNVGTRFVLAIRHCYMVCRQWE